MRLRRIIQVSGLVTLVVVICLGVAAAFFFRLPWITTETIRFQSGDVTLVGTLALPRWKKGPYSAAVAVHGSGEYPRWMHWLYAMKLTPYGMAVLMYDKRGVGDSTGIYPQKLTDAGTLNYGDCGKVVNVLAEDALAAIKWLRTRDNIDARRIGFVGISQAGWIMPLAASHTDDAKFIISISGPAVSCGLEIYYSDLTGDNPGTDDQHLSDEEIEQRLSEYDGPAYYDPIPVLADLKVSTLWVLGARDRSVPTSHSITNLNQLIAEQNAPFELLVFPEGNHLIRDPEKPMLLSFITFWPEVRGWLTSQGILPPT